jgi:hypothetical protein
MKKIVEELTVQKSFKDHLRKTLVKELAMVTLEILQPYILKEKQTIKLS